MTTGEKYNWNNTRQLPDPTGHVNGAVLSIMSNSGTRNVQWDGESEDDFVEFTFPDGVEVGGKLYNAIQIGDLIWMTSNLAYAPAGYGNGYSTGSTPCASQYLYASHPEWGYMYNMAALNDLLSSTSNWLPVGWRIPTRDDFIALGSVAGSSSSMNLVFMVTRVAIGIIPEVDGVIPGCIMELTPKALQYIGQKQEFHNLAITITMSRL